MARGSGRKGSSGCSMTISRRKKPKWMLASYEDRVLSRDASSANRRKRLEAKGKVQSLGKAIATHSCGQNTVLEPQDASWASYCPSCEVFAIA